MHLISRGDLIDFFYKIEQKGIQKILSTFKWKESERVKSKWNESGSVADFWVIPEVRRRWNFLSTGNPNLEYEDYFVTQYLQNKVGIKMLSIGCGTGSRERKFAKYPQFDEIIGIDVAQNAIQEAVQSARKGKFENIKYLCGDFHQMNFKENSMDVILFNSSLHHFNHIHTFLKDKILPILKIDGYLVIQEYVGPNRLQWTEEQLEASNELLSKMPISYRRKLNSSQIKNKVYRPGLIRMQLIDPSEAIDSESILPAIHSLFKLVEEKSLGWNITHILLKDISHHFLNKNDETTSLLNMIFEEEDKFVRHQGKSDAVFGIYQKF